MTSPPSSPKQPARAGARVQTHRKSQWEKKNTQRAFIPFTLPRVLCGNPVRVWEGRRTSVFVPSFYILTIRIVAFSSHTCTHSHTCVWSDRSVPPSDAMGWDVMEAGVFFDVMPYQNQGWNVLHCGIGCGEGRGGEETTSG